MYLLSTKILYTSIKTQYWYWICLALLIVVYENGCIVHASTNRIPQFNDGFVSKKLKENSPIGTYLMKATATDSDPITYSIIGDNNGNFKIDPQTGEVTVAKVIDGEQLKKDDYTILFKVAATEVKRMEAQATLDVTVYIIDVNEHKPLFEKEMYSANISENAERGSFVTLVKATDQDFTPGLELLYSIKSGNEDGYFNIDNYKGKIRTAKELDYERKSEFLLIVEVADGRPRDPDKLSSTARVYIRVIDEDDNGAAFKRNYSVTIVEGEKKGTRIAKVAAQDQDRGINAPVRYSIDPGSNIEGLFSINERSGEVFLNGNVDREFKEVYNLILLAEERLSSPIKQHRPGRTTLKVTVEDINDNSPEFAQKSYTDTIMEHEKIGTIILKAEAFDKDKGENAVFEYKLEGDKSHMFGISQSGDIFVQKDLDREEQYIYEFMVVAHQTGRNDVKVPVTIIVLDKNDHSPVFREASYEKRIDENLGPGVFIAKVSATDGDHGDNAKISYRILPDADGYSDRFVINPITGRIETNCSLDHEAKSSYSILVEASDNNDKDKKTKTVKVIIKVNDLNDNKPIFKDTEVFKSVLYDAPINTPIVKVEASDADSAVFGKVSYRIVRGNEEDRFHIDKLTGQLKVGDALAAYSGLFELHIEAYDNLGKKPSNVCNMDAVVKITIDKNGENSIVLTMKKRVTDVGPFQENIVSALKSILGIGIVTDKIEKGEKPHSTNFIFHGYNENTLAVVKKGIIIKALTASTSEEMVKFRRRWNITRLFELQLKREMTTITTAENNEKKNSDKWHPIIYAVLGFSALIAIFGMIGIIYLIKSKRRNNFDSGASQTSSRLPITARKSRNFWNDDAFESVSQGVPDSYVHSSGFLDRSCDRYELDPSNMYGSQDPYQNDPFSRVNDTDENSPRSRASSIFAASSVMTVVTAINNPSTSSNHSRRSRAHTQQSFLSPRERKLSVILDDEGKTRTVLNHSPIQTQRPPSYEYDLDEKVVDVYDYDA